MATQFESETRPESISGLVTGIMHDARELIAQQMTLFQVEIKNDIRQTIMGLIPLVLGIAVLPAAIIVLAFGAAELLIWAFPEHLARWGAFAIVGGAIIALGVVLIFTAKSIFTSFNPLPDKSIEALKENLQWKTKN
jgi:uncharacterized membrane protein YqjE